MVESVPEQALKIRAVLVAQFFTTLLSAMVVALFLTDSLSVLAGGLVVMLSTWHVHRSIYLSGGDRAHLLRSAGLRFVLFLLVLAAGVVLWDLQPIYLVAGMAASYVAMYVRSLIMIFREMKGDRLG